MSLLLITGASSIRGTMDLYLSQLDAAGIDYHIEGMTSVPPLGFGLGHKVWQWRRLVREFSTIDQFVFTDAWDVLFFGTKEDVLRKIPPVGILWGAEKNCYPNADVATRIPDRGPWRFANCGVTAGTRDGILEWCDRVETHPLYRSEMLDQEFTNLMLAEQSDLGIIDYHTELFFVTYGGYPELDFEHGLPVNRTYATHPNFLHSSGKWPQDELFAKYERSLQPCIPSAS